ncbi:MAG TPA: DinB family protein [Symbiobacteriaceae bacterium]
MQELLDRYLAGPVKLRESLAGLTEADLRYKYDPAKWSVTEIAIHVADMDEVAAFRMKRIIAEPNPSYPGVDQERWAANLGYQDRAIEPSVRLLEAVRFEMGIILSRLPEAAWARTGRHSEAGEETLERVVTKYTQHLETHIGQIAAIRQRLGK